jgi:hypothetical protein
MQSSLKAKLKDWVRTTPLYEWRLRSHGARRGPRIARQHGTLVPGTADSTFVVVCGADFNQDLPNAATTSRLGWCRGFEQLGIPYLLVSAYELARTLPELPNPMCWIAGSDYVYLDYENFQCLKRHRHAVLVSTAFEGESTFFRERGFPQQSWHPRLRQRIAASEPAFVFTMSGESRFEFYEGWLRAGLKLVSLPLACDTCLYEHPAAAFDFGDVDIAFVGGFWPYKAQQFDLYLKPLAESLQVFGYSAWPYGAYRGRLPEDQEAALYAQARISPIINEPHVCAMSVDINERVFKVLGAGGLGITDATNGYREWFRHDELLVPETLDEYHEMIDAMLRDPAAFQGLRDRGRQAVLGRHTYRHRAEQFRRLIDPNVALQGTAS